MNVSPDALSAAVDPVASAMRRLRILSGQTVIVDTSLRFKDAIDGKAKHEPIRTTARATGEATDYVIGNGDEPIVSGRIADGELILSRTDVVAGDIVDISRLEVSVS